MIVALVERKRKLSGLPDVVPTRAELLPTRNLRSAVKGRWMQVQGQGWQDDPALAEQGNAARSEPRHPNQLHRIRLVSCGKTRGGHGEKIVLDHIDVIPRREPVGWIQNVRLAPADKLLSQFQGDRTLGVGQAQFLERQCLARPFAVPPGEGESAVYLMVRIRAGQYTPAQTQ